MANNPSLRVTDFNDREILRIIEDECDEEGWTDIWYIAERCLPTHMRAANARRNSALRCTVSRLSYMKRLGLVERRIMHDKEKQTRYTQWRVKEAGLVFIKSTLTQAQRDKVIGADDGVLNEYAELLATQYTILGHLSAAMMRRQWQFGYGQRRR